MSKPTPTYYAMSCSLFFGVVFWILDSFQDYYFHSEKIRFLIFQAPMSLLDSMIFNVPPDDLIVRISFMVACLVGGFLASLSLSIVQRKNIERRKLEEQLFQSQKMEAIGTLAGGIAHDFNNLLTGILAYADLMILYKSKGDKDYSKLEGIIHSVKRGNELANRLLTVSRKIEPMRIPLDLNRNIIQMKRLLDSTIPKMIGVDIYMSKDPQIIEGDPGQLEQIMINLAINSKDSLPDGGKITISTETIKVLREFIKKDISYSNTSTYPKKGDYVLLTVSDNGCGIRKEVLDSIFDPFFTTKEVGKGTGLGLAVIYEIVKNHSGYIICYSELNKGTIFEIYFPVSSKIPKTNGVELVSEKIGGTETILVVDDEYEIRKVAMMTFEKEGYNTIGCATGDDALDVYRKGGIDLVLLDIIMPGIGGIKCLSSLIEEDSEVKVIMTSGFSNGKSNEVVSLGAKKFISKPYSIDNLLREVREVLDGFS